MSSYREKAGNDRRRAKPEKTCWEPDEVHQQNRLTEATAVTQLLRATPPLSSSTTEVLIGMIDSKVKSMSPIPRALRRQLRRSLRRSTVRNFKWKALSTINPNGAGRPVTAMPGTTANWRAWPSKWPLWETR